MKASLALVEDKNLVIKDFNNLVNMSFDELEKWLVTEDSISSGWKSSPDSKETIGHQSGRRIVEILKRNPDKLPQKYSDEDISHMKKVVSYCKRHLAQEKEHKNNPRSKSHKSLKNWGHDPLK